MASGVRFWFGAGRALARRPSLWPTAAAQAARLAAPKWWRHAPYLPLPDPAYLHFRLETQYGPGMGTDRSHGMEPHDFVAYLEWCREMAPSTRRRRETCG